MLEHAHPSCGSLARRRKITAASITQAANINTSQAGRYGARSVTENYVQMKVTTRLELINNIASELRDRYSFDEIISYLEAHGLGDLPEPDGSEHQYAKNALRRASELTIIKMADELTIGVTEIQRPDKWKDTKYLRMFVSHISEYKNEAMRLQECMSKYAISAFVAHQDITPTEEWEKEIIRALGNMEVFVSMHRPGFAASSWCQQEVGWAMACNVVTIPVMMGETPTGFLARKQGLIRDHRQHRAEDIAERINELIQKSPLHIRLLDAQIPF
jgi:hypothetical protein